MPVALAERRRAALWCVANPCPARPGGFGSFEPDRPVRGGPQQGDRPLDTNPQPTQESLRAGFLALLPRIQTHARIYTRHVRCPGKRDDLIAETVAVAWKWYLRVIDSGKDPAEFPGAFASLAARHAHSGRRLCGQDRAKDALSPRAQRIHGFTTQSLPEHDTGVSGNSLVDALAGNTRTPPPDQAAFRCDFPRFLDSLRGRRREVAEDLMLGERTQDAARKHKISQARVSQIRAELLLLWRRFHGEVASGEGQA